MGFFREGIDFPGVKDYDFSIRPKDEKSCRFCGS